MYYPERGQHERAWHANEGGRIIIAVGVIMTAQCLLMQYNNKNKKVFWPAASIRYGSHHEGDPSAVRLNTGASTDYSYPYLQVIAVT